MSYQSWLTDNEKAATKKLAEAQKAIKVAKFAHKIYDVVYEVSMNDKLAYQIATAFCFDRVIECKEFTEEEKEKVLNLQNEYKKIIA